MAVSWLSLPWLAALIFTCCCLVTAPQAWYATSQSKEEFCSGWESRPSKLQRNAKLQNTNIRCWTWTEAYVWSSGVSRSKWSTSLYAYDSACWKYNEAFRLLAWLNRTAVVIWNWQASKPGVKRSTFHFQLLVVSLVKRHRVWFSWAGEILQH